MEESKKLFFYGKHVIFLANQTIVSCLIGMVSVLVVLMWNYYPIEDFILFCIPNLIANVMFGLCFGSAIYKTNAYLILLSFELWIKLKRFIAKLLELKNLQHQPNFTMNLNKTFRFFIYIMIQNREYNLFWKSSIAIIIIWRCMIIALLSYIIFFYQLPVIVVMLYTLMWFMEQMVFVLLMIQMTNMLTPVHMASKILKQFCYNENIKYIKTKLKV